MLRHGCPGWLRILLVLFVALLLVACGNRTTTVVIRAKDMRFERAEVRMRAGQPVTLRLVNQDGYAHSFDLDELGLHIPLAGNETVEVTFVPREAGAYRFYCGSPGHTEAGMVGALTVAP